VCFLRTIDSQDLTTLIGKQKSVDTSDQAALCDWLDGCFAGQEAFVSESPNAAERDYFKLRERIEGFLGQACTVS
jgi:hypothetical protein